MPPGSRSVLVFGVLLCGVASACSGPPSRPPEPAAVAPLAPPAAAAKKPQACSTLPRLQSTTSRDGRTVAWFEQDPTHMDEGAMEAVARTNLCVHVVGGAPRLLVEGHSAPEPTRLLVNFGNLTFNPAGTRIYFSTDGWVTSAAAHGVDVATGREWFITDGIVIRELDTGRYAGDLLMQHFRLDDQHSIESPEYQGRVEMWAITDPKGKELVRLPEDSTTWEALGVPPAPAP